MIDPALLGKVAIVTGANHGLGAASARALAAQGCAVLLNYLRLPESATWGTTDAYRLNRTLPADAVLAEIRADGGRVEAWEAGHLGS
jgi:3-oxoacyl-[acyl-carrier protein] reductase